MHNNARHLSQAVTARGRAPSCGKFRPRWRSIRTSRIVVAGAGSIGCYVGGCLALAGRSVTLLLRPTLADAIARHGLRISDLEGADRTLPSSALTLATDPSAALAAAQIVLVTVKSGATAEMAGLIARHAPAEAIVVSLQNGVGNARCPARAACAPRSGSWRAWCPSMSCRSRAGRAAPRFHRATSGTMLIAAGVAGPARGARRAGRGRRRACRHGRRAVGQAGAQPQQCAQRAVRPAARPGARPIGAGACCWPRKSTRPWPC